MKFGNSPANSGKPVLDFAQTGFGLLEALVALVLLSSVGLTLLAWINQNVDTLARLRTFYHEQEVRRATLEWSRTLNPTKTPQGESRLGTLIVTWKSEPAGGVANQTGFPRGIGLHDLQLFETTLTVTPAGSDKPMLTERVLLLGHAQIRSHKPPFANE